MFVIFKCLPWFLLVWVSILISLFMFIFRDTARQANTWGPGPEGGTRGLAKFESMTMRCVCNDSGRSVQNSLKRPRSPPLLSLPSSAGASYVNKQERKWREVIRLTAAKDKKINKIKTESANQRSGTESRLAPSSLVWIPGCCRGKNGQEWMRELEGKKKKKPNKKPASLDNTPYFVIKLKLGPAKLNCQAKN